MVACRYELSIRYYQLRFYQYVLVYYKLSHSSSSLTFAFIMFVLDFLPK